MRTASGQESCKTYTVKAYGRNVTIAWLTEEQIERQGGCEILKFSRDYLVAFLVAPSNLTKHIDDRPFVSQSYG